MGVVKFKTGSELQKEKYVKQRFTENGAPEKRRIFKFDNKNTPFSQNFLLRNLKIPKNLSCTDFVTNCYGNVKYT